MREVLLRRTAAVVCPPDVAFSRALDLRSLSTARSARLLRWPTPVTLCVLFAGLMTMDVEMAQLVTWRDVTVANPLVQFAFTQHGWLATALKLMLPLLVFAGVTSAQKRDGRVPMILLWTLRLLVVEYAIAVSMSAAVLARWFFA